MKVAVLSKADARGGGASKVAEVLTDLLNSTADIQSVHYVAWSQKPPSSVRRHIYGDSKAVISFLHKYSRKAGFAELVPYEMISPLARRLSNDHDLFHFHDITTAYSPLTLEYLSRHKQVVWTFHDCSPFTGGCLHPSNGCERYKDQCGRCPNLGIWPLDAARDRTRLILNQKRRLHGSGRIHCVTPSQWLANKAWESGLLTARPTVIPNPVDTSLFTPDSRRRAREQLRIVDDRPVVLFSAGDLGSEKKGARTFAEVIRALPDPKPCVLLVGRFSPKAAEFYEGLDTRMAGYLNDPAELARVYSAADVFFNFSIADNLPLVVLETMACAVPTLAYATGGIPEMIEQHRTGVVVPTYDVDAAVRAARDLLSNPMHLAELGRAARDRAVREYSNEVFLGRHRTLYDHLLRRPAATPIDSHAGA